ncbi:flagellar basal body-associated FliL family protein [Jonesia quinghaiensis]|uniref:flagellar basal body-associated FliL family protein n=1 Tax=Jonesia quinghaiensis TaxID=262806 RepID=UPI000401FBA3|nr:flagellar basal body-associated FliL family protein [Jonesia quinghaiensis]
MPIEQRVVSGGRPQATPQRTSAPKADQTAAAPESPKKSKKGLMIIVAVVVLAVIGAAAYFFVLKPGGDTSEEELPPEVGEVFTIESMNINLAEGRYLRAGFGLQMTKDADTYHFDPAQARNKAIEVYSGQTFADVMDPVTREALRQQLAAALDEVYHGDVMDVYLTDYVAQ